MNRDDVFERIRDYLATELQVDSRVRSAMAPVSRTT